MKESNTPSFIDSHCHLDSDYSGKSVSDLVLEAKQAGVRALLTIATEIKTLDHIKEIAEKHEHVFFSVGVHPHEADQMCDGDLSTMESFTGHSKCKAIGEIGLDYYYEHSKKDVQIARMKDQLLLARKVKLPIIVHSRDAEEDLLPLLKNHCQQLEDKNSHPGVIHCFSGSEDFGLACLELGFFISFSGILTFKNAQNLRDFSKQVPLNRILLETDSPYLAPVPHRGKKCEPAMLIETAKILAQIKAISLLELGKTSAENTIKLFDLPLLAN